ncbi:DUF551 domain-containing protein [Pseudomonas tohonis]|uniref:DUF551 domain-containing protein n=1 Tax=Pseudomonas tohonis TaxID=2725477 RepID=UPI001F25516D|nr:DUF551 domain-containing protein [Pseudomonas tohonis]
MSKWIAIKDQIPPFDTSVLALWKNGHIEDAEFSDDGEDHVYHWLFDGESFADEPTHWMPLPEAPQ